MPKVSVIVPCYNVERYVALCIESLVSQTLKDIEIILVDDGSPDNSGKICDEYKDRDERIKVIHKANGGVSAARNDGLKEATGEYVIFVDSDDYVPSNACEVMYLKAIETSSDIVVGDVIRVADDGKEEYSQMYDSAFTTSDRKLIDALVATALYKNYCPLPAKSGAAFGYGGPWNKLVRRKLLSDHHISFDESVKGLFDDILYSAHIMAAANTVSYVHEAVYCYRLLGGSITQTYKKNMPEIAEAIIAAATDFVKRHEDNEMLKEAYYAFVIRMVSFTLPRYYCHRNYPGGLWQAARALRGVMSSSPYCEAAKGVNQNKLTRGQRGLAQLMRHRASLLAILYYKYVFGRKGLL